MATGIIAGTKELRNSTGADNSPTTRRAIQQIKECSHSGWRTNRMVQDHNI